MRQTGGGSSSQEEAPASKPTSNRFLIGFFVTFAVVAMLYSVGSSYEVPGPAFMEESTLDTNGAYVMKDFDKRKPMANFLNGIGGVWGIPMWAFYVNRGQVISICLLLSLSLLSSFFTFASWCFQFPFDSSCLRLYDNRGLTCLRFAIFLVSFSTFAALLLIIDP
jgi:hypothetical protein